MSSRSQEHVSPELVLVAPPEEAELARKLLAPAPSVKAESDAAPSTDAELTQQAAIDSDASDWDDFLTGIRSSTAPAAEERSGAPPSRITRHFRKPIVFAIVILAIAGTIGLAWARARSEDAATARSPSAPGVSQPALTPAKTVRSAKASKPTRKSKPKAKPGAFVPSRVWSWARAPGAAHYVVRFFHGGRRVFAARTERPELILPKSFAFHRGRYRWTVLAISAKHKTRRAIVDSTFVVARH